MDKKIYKLIWRFIAVICMLAWGIVLVYNIHIYIDEYVDLPDAVFSPFMGIIFCSITILVLAVIIVFPLKFGLYAILCSFWGLAHLIDRGSSSGTLMYMLGITFAFHSGFFKKYHVIKIIIAIVFPICALLSQIRFGVDQVTIVFLNLLAVVLIFGLSLLLFLPDIRKLRKNTVQNTNIIYLPSEQFSERDIRCLKKVQDGEKYESIAKDEDIGLSTLKSKMKTIYKTLNVYDKTSFLSTYAGYHILLKPTSRTSSYTFTQLSSDEDD
jgi:glucan phosphoethanolaminetransferase (alkaline phosphatase superfamily)